MTQAISTSESSLTVKLGRDGAANCCFCFAHAVTDTSSATQLPNSFAKSNRDAPCACLVSRRRMKTHVRRRRIAITSLPDLRCMSVRQRTQRHRTITKKRRAAQTTTV